MIAPNAVSQIGNGAGPILSQIKEFSVFSAHPFDRRNTATADGRPMAAIAVAHRRRCQRRRGRPDHRSANIGSE
jgi:hypothetical protein